MSPSHDEHTKKIFHEHRKSPAFHNTGIPMSLTMSRYVQKHLYPDYTNKDFKLPPTTVEISHLIAKWIKS